MSSETQIPAKILVLTDEHEIKLALAASDMYSALWDYMQDLRTKYKHGQDEDEVECAWWARELLAEHLSAHGVDMEELS